MSPKNQKHRRNHQAKSDFIFLDRSAVEFGVELRHNNDRGPGEEREVEEFYGACEQDQHYLLGRYERKGSGSNASP